MTTQSDSQAPRYTIKGDKVVLVNELTGDIHVTGEVKVTFLDTQPLSFDFLTARSIEQTRRLLEELQVSDKYNVETYEPRPEIERHINRFFASPRTGLLIFGESGIGKTNVLAHLCRQLLSDRQVVLFYSGFDFFDELNIEQRILKDCGSLHRIPSLREFFDTLDSLNQASEHFTDFVVVVDSVENARDPARLLRVLDSVISSVSYSWFKVIVTIQTGAYEAISSEHDTLDWQPIAPGKYYFPDGNVSLMPLPSVVLEPFNLTELQGAWNKTQIDFNLKSLPETNRNLIRHPYFFKLFTELYKSGVDTTSLFAFSTVWDLSKHYYETRLPLLKGRRRNPSRILLNELIGKLLEKRFVWFSILELVEDTAIGHYFTDYATNKPYANLLNLGLLQEHATSDLTDVRISFKSNPLFAYALYQHLLGCDDLTVEHLVSIVTELIPGPMGFSLEDLADENDLHKRTEAVEYFRILRSFWYSPLIKAIAHLLVDRWKMGEKETFVYKFFVEGINARALWAIEGIQVKFIEVAAREIPETLEQLIPSVLASYASLFSGINSLLLPVSSPENRLFSDLFDDLAENALTQEATAIVNALLSSRRNSPDEIVEFYLSLAKVHRAAHDDEQGLANLLEANKYAVASGNVAKMGRVANSIGVFYNETGGDPTTTIQWLERGLEFSIQAGQPRESIAASHFNIGTALANQQSFPRAVSHLEQSLKLIDIRKFPLRAAQILAEIGKSQEAQKNFREALNAYQQAISLYEANGRNAQIVDLIPRIGNILMMVGQLTKAASLFQLGLELGEDEPSVLPEQQFALMANLTLALARTGNIADAMTQFQKANEYHENIGLPPTQDYFVMQLNIARILADSQNFPEAIAIYTNSLSKFNSGSEDVLWYTMKSELGIVYLETGNLNLALDHMRDALPFFEARQDQDELPLAILYANLGTVYKKQGMTNQALEHYRKSYPLLLRLGMDELATKLQVELKAA